MEKYLKPERLNLEPDHESAEEHWTHWLKTFSNFMNALCTEERSPDKLSVLTNYLSPRVYGYISECFTYDEAIHQLQSYYVKQKNVVFARHLLSTRKQALSETLDQYLIVLRQLSTDCQFVAVTAEINREEAIRDAMITGLRSSYIRQRLLENRSLTLSEAYNQARALESAHKQAETYRSTDTISHVAAVAASSSVDEIVADEGQPAPSLAAIKVSRRPLPSVTTSSRCYFCGLDKHPRSKCPAREAICHFCAKRGHFSKVCKSTSAESKTVSASMITSLLAAAPNCLKQAQLSVLINGITTNALVDTGSSESFFSLDFAKRLKVKIIPSTNKIHMAATEILAVAQGYCYVSLQYDSGTPVKTKFSILKDLCADIILGHDVLSNHHSIEIKFNGKLPSLKVCGLATASVPAPSLFANLSTDCKPIADKSRRYSPEDLLFIKKEIVHLLKEDIIEPSSSPWRAQVLVTGGTNTKRRMVVDYSRTINRFTYLDAYPLPRMYDIVRKVSQYKIYSTLDLKSACHQRCRDHTRHSAGPLQHPLHK